MNTAEFIEQIASYVRKYAPKYGVKVYSPIIAQACLESAYGTSELAVNANNVLGIKYWAEVSDDAPYIKMGSEQNPDGTYVSSVMKWCTFHNFERCVEGYFQFLFKRKGVTRYNNLIGITDPRLYLQTIWEDHYATSLDYVDNLMRVINSNNLTRYDKEENMGYTNSPLIDYTDLNGNYNPRSDAPKYGCIEATDTITLHHMAGNLTVETCGRVFHSKAGSSNYGVGTDGRKAMYVEEKNRAWTSGSRSNDFRAVTIEIANDTLAPTWTVSDEALYATIILVADICQRNDIKKLVWSDNKSDRINHRNGCNMTMHQDFASTACPGPYVSGKEAYIAAEVNKILGGVEPEPAPTPEPTPSTVPMRVSDQSVKGVQTFLNTYYGTGLIVDGMFGPNTRKGIAKAYQIELNRLGAGLDVDGFFGGLSAKAFDKYVGCLKQGQNQNIFCTLWQCTLVGFGYKPNGIDGWFGSGCATATNLIFKHTGLPQDATVHSSDIDKLM